MPFLLFLLFIVLPFVEITLLLQIGAEIGALNTVAVIVGTGMVGAYLAKREGFAVWTRFQQKLAQGGMPGDELLDGLIILVSGALLVTPGVITDVVGFMGLLPPSRSILKSQIKKRFSIDTASRVTTQFKTSRQWAQSDSEQRVDITEIVDRTNRPE